jgi:hypothetical protein
VPDAPARFGESRLMSKEQHTGTFARHDLGLLAKAVIAAAAVLFLWGVFWHGVTIDNAQRIWRNMIARPNAALSFRFILQPSVAAITAINNGLKDAWNARSPFFRALLREPTERISRLNEGLNATARILLLGIAVDVIYQFIEFERFYPVESLLIAVLLAFVPYCVIRGLVVRVSRKVGFVSRPDHGR